VQDKKGLRDEFNGFWRNFSITLVKPTLGKRSARKGKPKEDPQGKILAKRNHDLMQ